MLLLLLLPPLVPSPPLLELLVLLPLPALPLVLLLLVSSVPQLSAAGGHSTGQCCGRAHSLGTGCVSVRKHLRVTRVTLGPKEAAAASIFKTVGPSSASNATSSDWTNIGGSDASVLVAGGPRDSWGGGGQGQG